MRHLISSLLALSLMVPMSAHAAAATANPATAARAVAIPSEVRTFSLKQISGGRAALQLRSTLGSATVRFGTRGDELVNRAVLHLHYTFSPSLIEGQSHIRVHINDEVISVIPLRRDEAGRTLTRDVEINPKLLADFNALRFDFIGHYDDNCEDPHHSSLWADISSTSTLEMTVRRLELTNDLSLLPEPFFDRRDNRKLTLPFVFASSPSRETINAAGVVSSWFGKLAAWRGARFPVGLNLLPRGHAIVFATNKERPSFLEKHEPVNGPTLKVVTSPADGYSKLLLVLGRDGKDLQRAAHALVIGNAALSGSVALVSDVTQEGAREPYDAPNWARTDRPMKFGELVDSPQNLQVFGHYPEPVIVNVRVPPDLFTWQSRGVPVDLKYRYPPPVRAGESRLTTLINDELVQAFNLRASGEGGDTTRMRLPLLDDALFGENRELFLPAFKLGARNTMQFNYSFVFAKEGNCRDSQMDNVRAMIDADSTVDFSGFPHYAEMPNLNYFVSSGYPFTKYADLSQTVVVLPEKPAAAEIATMLTLLGRMGESTGYPATRVRVAAPSDEDLFDDADLLLIGAAPRQALLEKWKEQLPAEVNGTSRRVSEPARAVSLLYNWLGFGTEPDPSAVAQAQMEDRGALAAMIGFESPVSSKRSVVAVTATAPEQLASALDALEDPARASAMHGSVAFIHPHKVESMLVGETYFVGHLPFWTSIWYPLSTHPLLLAVLAVLAVLVFAFALWRTLRYVAERRHGVQ